MKTSLILSMLCGGLISLNVSAQKDFNDYLRVYPISDDANIGYKTTYTEQETIILEANPIVRFNFYNNIAKELMNDRKHVYAVYLSARPQLRIYTDNSLPVKMPSYRLLLGTQQLCRIKNNLLAFSLESGHYSNGASGCACKDGLPDSSPGCQSVYRTINNNTDLSRLINRTNGNFSTNMTELISVYRFNKLDNDNRPEKTLSFRLGVTHFHDRIFGIIDFAGFTKEDIKLYGRYRLLLGTEYMKVFREKYRYSISANAELIRGAHPSVNPLRVELIGKLYPFPKIKELGLFAQLCTGHDNYNLRFVDSGRQGFFGLTWDVFPPIQIKRVDLEGPNI